MPSPHPIDDILPKLNYRQAGDNQWEAKCPCRSDDDNPSLRISVGKQDQVLFKCLRGDGCSTEEVVESIGLQMSDLWPSDSKKLKKEKLTLVDTYPYYDEEGTLVFEVQRFVNDDGKKTFRQRSPKPDGGWEYSTKNIDKPLYNLPKVLEAIKDGKTIYVVEGEKDVHTLDGFGQVATTNAGGAVAETSKHKWTEANTASLAGANIVIIADNDQPGIIHARTVASLVGLDRNIKGFVPSKFNDISDMLGAGVTLADGLEPLDLAAPPSEEHTTSTPDVEALIDPKAEALDQLLKDIETIHGLPASAPTETIIQRVQAKVDAFELSVDGLLHKDRGRLVSWPDFLAEEADDSYDWVIPGLLEREERVMVVAAEGAGKRLNVFTPIPTPTGWVRMGNIDPGDKVFDRHGFICNVTSVSDIEVNPDGYRLSFSAKTPWNKAIDNTTTTLEADAEHQWYVETVDQVCSHMPGSVMTTKQILEGMADGTTYTIPVAAPLKLPLVDLPIEPYTLGAWLGCGRQDQATLNNPDPQVLTNIQAEGYEVTAHKIEGNWGIPKFKKKLRESFLLNNKQIPPEYLRASYPQRQALLQGIMDTAGHLNVKDNIGKVSFQSESLARNFHELAVSLGATADVAGSRSITSVEDWAWTITYHTHLPLPRLDYDSQGHLPTPNYRYITDIEKLAVPPAMRCIMVDSPDNTYLAGPNMIPTHNTTLARQICLLTAAGIHPFRFDPIPKQRTMMIDLENPSRIIRRTSQGLHKSLKKTVPEMEDLDAHLFLLPAGLNLLKPADRLLMEEQISEVNPDILFMGPLYKAFIYSDNRPSEAVATEVAMFLDYIRTTYSCALWLEHHAPLGSGGQRDLRPFGSAVWSRWSEYGLSLQPDPTDPNLIEFRHYRGQREAREWPEICQRGQTWPFEPITWTDYGSLPGTEDDSPIGETSVNDPFEF